MPMRPLVRTLRASQAAKRVQTRSRGRACRAGSSSVRKKQKRAEVSQDADEQVGNVDAGEDEDAEAGEGDEACVEAGAGAKERAAGEGLEDEGEGGDGESKRQAGGGGGGSEEAHGSGHEPVEERGFLEVADAVGVESDEVVAEEHLAGDLCVHGVGVVEQRRGEEGEGAVKEEPEGEEDEAVSAAGRAGLAGAG